MIRVLVVTLLQGGQLSHIRDDTAAAFQLSMLFSRALHTLRCLLKRRKVLLLQSSQPAKQQLSH